MLAAARPPECVHEKTEIRSRVVQGGGVQIKKQCLSCGQPLGNPLRKADFPHTAPFDEELLQKREADERRLEWRTAVKYKRKLELRELGFQLNYDSYIRSPKWQKKRLLILKRCGGLCEGCMENNAKEVHHLTYKHFGDELLFELVALCQTCHGRIHDGYIDPPDERLCRACRYQGDGKNCGVFGVSEQVALMDARYCGPNHSGFEPLK